MFNAGQLSKRKILVATGMERDRPAHKVAAGSVISCRLAHPFLMKSVHLIDCNTYKLQHLDAHV